MKSKLFLLLIFLIQTELSFQMFVNKTVIYNKLTDNYYYDKTYTKLSLNNKLNSSEITIYYDKTQFL